MRRLLFIPLILLVVVAVLATLGDEAVRTAVQKNMDNRIKASSGASSVSTQIHGFPFLYDVAVEGKVSGIDIEAKDVPVGPLRIAEIDVDAHQIRLDRGHLLTDRQAVVSSIATATVNVEIKTSGLASVLSSGVFAGSVSVRDGHDLVVSLGGRTLFSLDLTLSPIIPGCNMAVRSISDGYDLSCSVAPVPQSVIAALSALPHG